MVVTAFLGEGDSIAMSRFATVELLFNPDFI
jgi:hypothetical protein